MKGSAIVVDQATKYFSKSVPPPSLYDTFIAVFVGPEESPDVDTSFFGTIDAHEFREDAQALQQVNETYADAHLNDEELRSGKADGAVPPSLRS